jgi:hypothetical protein
MRGYHLSDVKIGTIRAMNRMAGCDKIGGIGITKPRF